MLLFLAFLFKTRRTYISLKTSKKTEEKNNLKKLRLMLGLNPGYSRDW
jgi:hypothetical protein